MRVEEGLIKKPASVCDVSEGSHRVLASLPNKFPGTNSDFSHVLRSSFLLELMQCDVVCFGKNTFTK